MVKSLVTGGTGFIGAHVVKLLLERGHIVHTTVRSLNNKNKIKCLTDLQTEYPQRLFLFEADLLKDGSYTAAMEDCEVVYHIASPFMVPQQIKNGQKEIVDPAINGTKNVLKSVNDTQSVKRVVLTSSMVACFGDIIDTQTYKDKTLHESDWNTTSTATSDSYAYSKVASEREAWKMNESQTRWDLVVICPTLVLGPSLSADPTSGTFYMLENLFGGKDKMGVPELHFPVVDVRDVAFAHVAAGENPDAKGRYLVSSGDKSLSMLEMAHLVKSVHENPGLLPTRQFPKLMAVAAGPFVGMSIGYMRRNIGYAFKVDAGRSAKEFGIQYKFVEDVVQGHYLAWKESQKK